MTTQTGDITDIQAHDAQQLTTQRLEEIKTELAQTLTSASSASRLALEAGSRAGELLHEARSICESTRRNYRAWLESQRLSRDKARVLEQLHIDWPTIKDRLDGQTLLPFTEIKRITDAKRPDRADITGAMLDDQTPAPDDAYSIPQTLSEDFHYPDEDEDTASHAASETLAGIFRYVVPKRLEKREDWRTFAVRVVGMAFLSGAMPDNVSMRDACAALGVSHATISKYVRQLSDATGIRSPIQKREGAREVYRKVQTEGHWRRRGE